MKPISSNAAKARRLSRGKLVLAVLAILSLICASGLVWLKPLAMAATGTVSHGICAAAFISGIDPELVFREEERPLIGAGTASMMHYEIDRPRHEVRATFAGIFSSRAVFRDGYGCHIARGIEHLPSVDQSDVVATTAEAPLFATALDPRFDSALDEAFSEVDARRLRQTQAIVVIHNGKIVAERYATGITAETPIWGHSLTKSVTSALFGILVREGKAATGNPASVAAWQDLGNPHHGITNDQLLRMISGLPFDETNAILSSATRMFMLEGDSAEFAAKQALVAKPGAQWGYSNMSYALLSRSIRDIAGEGDAAKTRAFIQREFFEPLGLTHATMEFDGTGTPNGAGFMFATAREWARIGQLYLDDGMVGDRRILEEGWIRYSATQSLKTTGYGAGFWTNVKTEGEIPYWGIEWGLPSAPTDTFFGRGFLGQFVVIVPSEQLVVVRLGLSHDTSSGVNKFLASIFEVLRSDSTR